MPMVVEPVPPFSPALNHMRSFAGVCVVPMYGTTFLNQRAIITLGSLPTASIFAVVVCVPELRSVEKGKIICSGV